MASASPLSNARQWRIVAVLAAAIAALLALAYYWFLAGDYAPLVRGVKPEEAAAIVEQLKKEDVPYRLEDGGATILVPAKMLDAARLDVSSHELPLKGTVGFELFNQSDMGLTDFAQKVNYQRALQGEIARTIMTMDGIAYARVHIALPERSLFRTARSEPRAAVTLTPEPGVDIDAARIAGIQRLVAATVPDLALDQVAILNERGQLLTPEFSDVPGASGSETALESNYRERAARVVAEAAPRAHVEVKVTLVPRDTASTPGSGGNAEPRDHSIRLVLFERTALMAAEEQAIRSAIMSELALDSRLGDQLSFSPAPEIAAAAPPQLAPARSSSAIPAKGAEDKFMESLARGWAVAFSLLGGGAIALVLVAVQRRRRGRRDALLARIKEHLLLPDGAADAA